MNDIKYWIWYSSLIRLNPRKRFEMLEIFKEPAYIWHATEAELKRLTCIDGQDISYIMDRENRKAVNVHYEAIKRNDISILTIRDALYPEELKYIYDPPAVLYYKGVFVKDEVRIAVVGSRRATAYGLMTSERLSQGLAANGIVIVSGMARGIDSKAHSGALAAGGRTLAVLGCGLDIVYPSENRELMKRICQSGAVISEYLPGTAPAPFNFPARNRIISGLSQGVVLVEANERSGSLITANYALEQGKEVFAVPGNIDSPNSWGTNKLIRDGAKIVLELGDILDELNIEHNIKDGRFMKRKRIRTSELDLEEKTIIRELKKGPLHIDDIARKCNFNAGSVSSMLVMLEMKGFVEQLPGKFYKLPG